LLARYALDLYLAGVPEGACIGLPVCGIGLGGASAGLANYLHTWGLGREAAMRQEQEAIAYAVACDVNYYDMAPAHGACLGEQTSGEALELARQRIVLATRVTGQRANLSLPSNSTYHGPATT